MFRVDPLEEEVGLDISHHRGSAYDLSGPNKEDVEELMEVRASRHGKVEVPLPMPWKLRPNAACAAVDSHCVCLA